MEIQQARRFEKNYLLYGASLDDAFEALGRAKELLGQHEKTIKKIIGAANFKIKSEYVSKYWDQLLKLKNIGNNESKKLIVPDLRKYGGQIVSFAQEFVKKERSSVAHRIITMTTTIHFSGLNTEPVILLRPASDSRYRVYLWTSLLTCWLVFSLVGLS